jgi:nucleoside-diphosphate-sugar epimerase
MSSPTRTVEGLIAVFEASREAFNGRTALNLPALNVRVSDMLEALARIAGPTVRDRVTFVRDERIAGIVANWPSGASSARAARLGMTPHASFDELIRQYIDDCAARPNADQTLKGMSR